MRVRILTNLGSNDYPGMPYLEGETHEVNDVTGAKLINAKVAVKVDDLKVEDPPPKIMEPEPARAVPVVQPPPEPKEDPKSTNKDKFSEMRAARPQPTNPVNKGK